MIVDPKLVEAFDRDGYCIVPGALPPAKVRELLDVVDRHKDRLAKSEHKREVFGLDVRPIVTEDPAFMTLLEWPATFPLAVRCLKHYSLQLNTSHLIMVPPSPSVSEASAEARLSRAGAGVTGGDQAKNVKTNIGWHQDGGSPGPTVDGVRAMFSLKIGYFLTDLLEPDMGQLMVVPGSHRFANGLTYRDGATEPEGAIQLKVRAGDAVLFQNPLYHGGAPNRSQQTRIVLYYGYSYRWLKPIDYETLPPELLASASPIGRQLLGARSSHLGWYIPTEQDTPLKAQYREWFGETWIH